MSWTTVCDLRMSDYAGGQVVDSTDFHNNGVILGGATPASGLVTFAGPDDQIEVPVRDASLGEFAALRVQALVKPGPIVHRYNIAEGWMSFALMIEANGQLAATVYDGHQWIGPNSGSAAIASDRWSRVMFEFDGVSIASLWIDGALVGSRFDMPVAIRPPHQVIALGHWPRGDGRYTLVGSLGHFRIEKRNVEDFWRDALGTALCRRRLSGAQANALKEIEALVAEMDPIAAARLRTCAQAQSERMRALVHTLRTGNPRDVAHLRRLGDRLRGAWCCTFDRVAARDALLEYFRAVSDGAGPERSIEDVLEEFIAISEMCAGPGRVADRVRELGGVLFPELTAFRTDLRDIADSI